MIQSEKISGNKNMACRSKVKEKLSKKMVDRLSNPKDKINYSGRTGITFHFIYNEKKYFLRSFEEFKIVYTLLYYDQMFEYEKITLKYNTNEGMRYYKLDILFDEYYIEIKADKEEVIANHYENTKYKLVNQGLKNIGKELHIFNYEMFCKKFGFEKHAKMFFIKAIREMLDKDMMFGISQYIQKTWTPRLINQIDNDWQNNNKISVNFYKGEK
jgi:hypothetical protein